MDAIRAEAPNTIVIVTADNGAWLDAYPDAGTTPFRGEKGRRSKAAGASRHHVVAWHTFRPACNSDEMMSHIDAWATLAAMVGLTPPPHDWVGNDGKPIYFDSIDNSAYILGKAPHSARNSWIYIDGETFNGCARRHRRRSHRSPGCTSRGSTSTRPRTPGSAPVTNLGRDRRALQPHHGSVREIRHDLQRRGADAGADDVAGKICGRGQWLGVVADRAGDRRLRQDRS